MAVSFPLRIVCDFVVQVVGLTATRNEASDFMPEPPPLPKGLVFFPPGTPPARRRQRLLFVATLIAAALALVWPIYPLFSGGSPLVFGLPLSLAWVVLWLAVILVALGWLYWAESGRTVPQQGQGMP